MPSILDEQPVKDVAGKFVDDVTDVVPSSTTLLPHLEKATELPAKFHIFRLPSTVIILCALLITIVDVGSIMVTAPQIRIFESIICYNYYKRQDPGVIGGEIIPEHLCKINVVQEEIALLDGWQTLFDNVPGLLMAVPYGVLAERWGRKPVLFLIILGLSLGRAWSLFVCYAGLSLRLTWLSSAFFLIGGGPIMSYALILMMVADVTVKEQRATTLFQLQAIELASELIAPPIGSLLMARNLWSPMFVGLAIQSAGIGITLIMPETRQFFKSIKYKESSNPIEVQPILSNNNEDADTPPGKMLSRFKDYREALAFFQDWNIFLLLLTFLICIIGQRSIQLLLQYVSKRYGWTLAHTNYLLSLRATVNLGLLLIVLPLISVFLLTSLKKSAAIKDLVIARVSILLYVIGCLVIAVSPNAIIMVAGLITYTAGTGFNASVRTLVTGLVPPASIARLYTAIAITETVGGLIAGPSYSLVFQIGLGIGGGWLGLPFMLSAALFVIVVGIMFAVRIRAEEIMGEEQHQSGDERAMFET